MLIVKNVKTTGTKLSVVRSQNMHRGNGVSYAKIENVDDYWKK